MAKMEIIVSFLCFAVFPMVSGSTSYSTTLRLTSDHSDLIPILDLPYRGPGNLVISLSNVSVTAQRGHVNWTEVGFVLLPRGEFSFIHNLDRYGRRMCIVRSPYIPTLSLLTRWGFNESFPVYLPRESLLVFANCNKVEVSMDVHAEFYPVAHKSPHNYRFMDQERLVPILLYFSMAYFAVLFLWGLLCNPKKRYVQSIHVLMSALLLLKALDFIFDAMKMDPQPPDFIVLSGAVHKLLFYVILALIIIGQWKLVTSLHWNVRILAQFAIFLQGYANAKLFIMNFSIGQFIPDFEKLSSLFLATNLKYFLPVMGLTLLSIKLLEQSEAHVTMASSNHSSKHGKIMATYIAAMPYLYFLYSFVFAPKIAANKVFGLRTYVVAEEGAHIVLFMLILYLFRPEKKEASG